MALERKEIFVYAHWNGIETPFLMGILYSMPSRGKEIFSFEYDKGWLQSDYAQIIDPDLQLFEGAQYLNNEKSNFGIFLDSSPDRWGRVLMIRKEAAKARIPKWLNMLMAPGSSLGGARPKANIQDTDGSLWIAKFPSQNDQQDMDAWEMLAYRLALQSGIDMAPSRIQKFSHHQHTFLTQRFDREIDGTRIHFAYAMTLLGYTDGTDYRDGGSVI